VQLTLGMASPHHQKPAQAATALVAVFVALQPTANDDMIHQDFPQVAVCVSTGTVY